MNPTLDPRSVDVLDFWFGAPHSAEFGSSRKIWFTKDAAFDAQIRERFGPLIDAALIGRLLEWQTHPRSALARILVLDQFTRNAFRETPRSFAGDALALSAAQALVASSGDLVLAPVERGFAYLPFEHSENLAMQDEALRLFGRLANDAPQQASLLDWAQRHHAIVARFARFPHRNDILGRASSDEEIEFLKQPGSGF
ncbi:MAG: DUF924 family protein [Burkholderiaceae bacterium]